jgi:hypothetical protein
LLLRRASDPNQYERSTPPTSTYPLTNLLIGPALLQHIGHVPHSDSDSDDSTDTLINDDADADLQWRTHWGLSCGCAALFEMDERRITWVFGFGMCEEHARGEDRRCRVWGMRVLRAWRIWVEGVLGGVEGIWDE